MSLQGIICYIQPIARKKSNTCAAIIPSYHTHTPKAQKDACNYTFPMPLSTSRHLYEERRSPVIASPPYDSRAQVIPKGYLS